MQTSTTSKTILLALLGGAVSFALLGCDEESAEHEHDDHGDHGEQLEPDTYEAGGITKMTDAGHFMVTLVSDPEPPSKGLNTWTLTVMSHEDMSMVDEATVTIDPWMPEHGHGSASDAVVEAMGQGDYMSDTVELQMLGTWDTTVTVTHGDMTDEVHFVFMVE